MEGQWTDFNFKFSDIKSLAKLSYEKYNESLIKPHYTCCLCPEATVTPYFENSRLEMGCLKTGHF